MKTARTALMSSLLLAAATAAFAQQGPPPGAAQGPPPASSNGQGPGQPGPRDPRRVDGRPMPGPAQGQPDPLMSNLFPPDLIMQNQQALNLTDEQRNYMVGEIQRTQSQSAAIQWRLQAAVERLTSLVASERMVEGQVLTQLDSVLASEREMKRLQIGLLVRLKAHLTAEQQELLRMRIVQGQPREE